MKSIYILILSGFIILFLASTNPSAEEHREKVSDKFMDAILDQSDSDENEWQQIGTQIGKSIGGALIEKIVKRENYLLFSLGKIEFNGKRKYVSVGIAGMVLVQDQSLDQFGNGNMLSDESPEETEIPADTEKEVPADNQMLRPVTDAEIIRDLQLKFLAQKAGDRSVTSEIQFGDLNRDEIPDAFIDWCIEATEEDRNAGGGNAMSFMQCIEDGFSVYLNDGIEFHLTASQNKRDFADEGFPYKLDRIENGKIYCTSVGYADGDPRCCPSLVRTIVLTLDGNAINRVQ